MIHDLSIRDEIDAEGVVRELLDRWFPSDGFEDVAVVSEASPSADGLLLDHTVVMYMCGPPEQIEGNLRAWRWKVPLYLTVVGEDAEHVRRVCARIGRRIAACPYEEPCKAGRVARVLDNAGFTTYAAGNVLTSKTAHTRVSSKVLQMSDYGV